MIHAARQVPLEAQPRASSDPGFADPLQERASGELVLEEQEQASGDPEYQLETLNDDDPFVDKRSQAPGQVDTISAGSGVAFAQEFPAIHCPDGEVLIGVQGTFWDYVRTLHGVCGRASRSGLVLPTGMTGLAQGRGDGIEAYDLECPPGQVIVGLIGSASLNLDRMGIECGSLDAIGVAIGESFRPGDSVGADGLGDPYHLRCPSGRSASGMKGWAGEGIGQIQLVCEYPSIVSTTADDLYCADAVDWDEAWIALEEDLLDALNEARRAGTDTGDACQGNPVAALTMDPFLRCAARRHAQDMHTLEFRGHDNPYTGSNAGDRAEAAGYRWTSVGENIGYGHPNVASQIAGWLGSAGHCKNAMGSEYEQVGIGYFPEGVPCELFSTSCGDGKTLKSPLFVAVFGSR